MANHGRCGPIEFLLARIPACIAIIGLGLIVSPRLFFYVVAKHIESTGAMAPGATTPEDVRLVFPAGVTFGTATLISTAVGIALLASALGYSIWRLGRNRNPNL